MGKVEEIFEEAIDDHFPKLMKENKPCIQEHETTLSRMNNNKNNNNRIVTS